jgi:Ca2+-binding RTX toxin-like protein
MALQTLSSSSVGTGVRVNLSTSDDALVMSGVVIGSTDDIAIFSMGGYHVVDVQGSVTAHSTGIRLGSTMTDAHNQVLIGDGGYVSSEAATAVWVMGHSAFVQNHGTIVSQVTGLLVGGSGADKTSVIVNAGLIQGGDFGVVHPLLSNDTVELHNSGEIRGGTFSYCGANVQAGAKDIVFNSGLMVGDISLGAGDDTYDGRSGGRVVGEVHGGSGDDFYFGGEFNDVFRDLGSGADHLDGGSGNDFLDGGAGGDMLIGGSGNDTLDGGAGADTMRGGLGSDLYVVDDAGDVVSEDGGDGTDTVKSTSSFSLANTGRVFGAVENLTLTGVGAISGTGNALNNKIIGNSAANTLNGGAGNDVLIGGAGIDRLHGGLGRDTLTGGADRDYFVFDTKPSSANRDIVTDFTHGLDKFQLEDAVFKGIGAVGSLKSACFYNGKAAHDADDRIIYNKATGALSYDADGTGDLAPVQIALLTNKPVLTAGDFMVI